MKQELKVLQIQPKFQISTSSLQEEVINALAGKEFHVTTAYLNGHPLENGMKSTSKHIKYFNIPKKKLKGVRLSAMFHLWTFCKDQQFDVIITHRFKPLFMMLFVNKLLKKPARCIAVLHSNGEFDRPYRRLITRLLTDKFWKYVGVSKSVKHDLLQYNHAGFNNNNVVYINNALNINNITTGLLSKASAREKLKLNSNDFVFGTIGRLVRVKGQIYLLKAFKQIHLKFPSAKLVIIGGGKLEQDLKGYIQENSLESAVIMTGELVDAYQYIPAFDTFVLPSLSEAFGLVILEAMIASIPVIATDVGGIKYVLSEKGRLIQAANTNALVSAMDEYIQMNKSQIITIGNDLRQRAEDEFSIKHFHKNYQTLVTDFQLS